MRDLTIASQPNPNKGVKRHYRKLSSKLKRPSAGDGPGAAAAAWARASRLAGWRWNGTAGPWRPGRSSMLFCSKFSSMLLAVSAKPPSAETSQSWANLSATTHHSELLPNDLHCGFGRVHGDHYTV
jgi:hypothetical protein